MVEVFMTDVKSGDYVNIGDQLKYAEQNFLCWRNAFSSNETH